jgi:carboxypeptidase family protein
MSLSKHSIRAIVFAVCAVFLVAAAHAQYRAGIQGVIADAQGAVVEGATITLTAKETGISKTTTSDSSGVYAFSGLAPGRYSLVVEKTGFKKQVLDDVLVVAEQTNAVNVQLQVGQVTEAVTVSAEAAPIETQSGTVAGSITTSEIQALPSFGRDVFQLLQLAPGVFGDGSRNAGGDTQAQPGNQGPGGTGGSAGIFQTENRPQISANGGRQNANNVTLDGIGITSVSWGGAAIITPNEDSVAEVKVVSNGYDAENGRFAGAQVQVITQNGTNQYHGSFFFKADRPGLNSFQPWSGTAGSPTLPQKNTNRFNQWGGSAGGPILKNKLFAFFAYETIRNHSMVTSTGWYETAALLKLAPSGSLAARYAAFPGESPAGTAVIDQTCGSIGLIDAVAAATLTADGVLGAQANCVEIPGQGLNIGKPLTSALGTSDPSQLPPITDPKTGQVFYRPGLGGDGSGNGSNLDPTTANIAFIQTGGPNNTTNQQYNGRLDYNATGKDLIAFNIYKVPVDSTNFNGARPANLFHHNAINEAETALWSHTFSPTLINEARVNAAGWRWNELRSNPQIPLGLPQTAFIGDPTNDHRIGTAKPGDNALGGPAGSVFDQWTYGYKDTVSKVHASHLLKFGGELTDLHFVQEAPWSARPNWGFNNYWDFLNDAPSFETGVFNPQTGVPTDVRKDSRSTLYALFAQDDYKLRPNLTLNLGLRWEYFGPISFTRNQLATVVLGSGANALTGMSIRVGGNLYNADKHNFGPQIGFAWSPKGVMGHEFNNKFVVRGGFGIAYNNEEEAITLNG